jgi:hypothetical protein
VAPRSRAVRGIRGATPDPRTLNQLAASCLGQLELQINQTGGTSAAIRWPTRGLDFTGVADECALLELIAYSREAVMAAVKRDGYASRFGRYKSPVDQAFLRERASQAFVAV